MEPALCRSPVPAQLRAPRDAGQQQDTAPSRLRESGVQFIPENAAARAFGWHCAKMVRATSTDATPPPLVHLSLRTPAALISNQSRPVTARS